MKPFLIEYDLNYNGYKNLIALVYAENYGEAVGKLKKSQVKIGENATEKAKVISHINLTIE